MARPGGKVMFATTAHARQLFLFGNGDGNRIVNVTKLSEVSGVSRETLCNYLPTWEAEYEKILLGTHGPGLELRLREEDLKAHHADMDFLRQQLEAAKWETEILDESLAKMESFLTKFDGDDGDRREALTIFDNYVRCCAQRSSLRSQFLALQKQWATLSGIVDLKDIQAAAAKAMETGRAKIKLKAEGNEAPRDVTPASQAANLLRGSK